MVPLEIRNYVSKSIMKKAVLLSSFNNQRWVLIPFEAWMSVCVYSVSVLVRGLATG
jgi:hypothetical protein